MKLSDLEWDGKGRNPKRQRTEEPAGYRDALAALLDDLTVSPIIEPPSQGTPHAAEGASFSWTRYPQPSPPPSFSRRLDRPLWMCIS